MAPTFTVERPAEWAVNDPADAPPCRYFDRETFDVPENSETVGIAIHLGYQEVPFEVTSNPGEESETILDRRETEVDGLQGVRLRLRSTGQGLLDEGVELVNWSIQTGDQRSFVATTIEAAGNFEENIAVLDTMMETLDFSVEEACSAAEMVSPAPKAELSEQVAERRDEILAGALSCDYERLDELSGEEGFTFSYGDSADFGDFLQEGESRGDDPLRKLVQIMGATPREFQIRDETHQVWPAAATYGSWGDIPEDSVDELRAIYTPDVLESFEAAEQYLGYRTAISGQRKLALLRRRRLTAAGLPNWPPKSRRYAPICGRFGQGDGLDPGQVHGFPAVVSSHRTPRPVLIA